MLVSGREMNQTSFSMRAILECSDGRFQSGSPPLSRGSKSSVPAHLDASGAASARKGSDNGELRPRAVLPGATDDVGRPGLVGLRGCTCRNARPEVWSGQSFADDCRSSITEDLVFEGSRPCSCGPDRQARERLCGRAIPQELTDHSTG